MSQVLSFSGEVYHGNDLYLVEGVYHPGSDFNYWAEDAGPQVTVQLARKWCVEANTFLPPFDLDEDLQQVLEAEVLNQNVHLRT